MSFDGSITQVSGVPLPLPSAKKPTEFPALVREKVYSKPDVEVAEANLAFLDADQYDEKGKLVSSYRDRFVTNENFNSAQQLDRYLRFWGKIPQFLEVRFVPGKGFGIFTRQSIAADTFLGFYQGLPRYTPDGWDEENPYTFELMVATEQESVGVIDAWNLTFSNFTRLLNHSRAGNCKFKNETTGPLIFTNRAIAEGEELTFDYGPEYWDGKEDQIIDTYGDE